MGKEPNIKEDRNKTKDNTFRSDGFKNNVNTNIDKPERLDNKNFTATNKSANDFKGANPRPEKEKKDLGNSVQNKINNKNEQETNSKTEVNSNKSSLKSRTKSLQNNAKNAFRILQSGLSFMLTPFPWIFLFIALLVVVFLSGTQIMGKSDFAKNCDPSGSTTIANELSKDQKERANQIASWLVSNKFEFLGGKPMSKEQAAGMIGNMTRESMINSSTVQTISIGNPDYYKTCDNECVLSWGSVGGKAIGLIQWDSGRRVNLVNFAKSKGKQWYDAEIQLIFLEDESSKSERPSYMKNFARCTSVASCVMDFCVDVERAGHPAEQERIAAGESFAKDFSGASGGSGFDSGTVATCSGEPSGMDTSGVVQLALSIAYPWDQYQKSYVGSDDSNGKNNALPAYKDAKALAEKNGGADPMPGLYASCDRFVATVLKASKADVDVPWGSTTEQYAYFSKSPKWTKVSCNDRKPGDIIITTTNGHVALYVGDVKGSDSLSSGSYGGALYGRVGATGPMAGCAGDAFNADGHTNTVGFRLK